MSKQQMNWIALCSIASFFMGALWLVAAPNTGDTNRVNVRTDGQEAVNGASYQADVSADGRYITFESLADNFILGDDNQAADIFLHDRSNGQTRRVSVNSDGEEGNFASGAPSISDDGRYIVFHSFATNLVTDDTNNVADIFIHDRDTGDTDKINVVLNGNANDISYDPVISGNGQFVAFWSHASNLVGGDTNNQPDVFVYDRTARTMVRISVSSDGSQGDGESVNPDISADGRYITFESTSTNLAPGDGNGYRDIFRHDRITGETIRVSLTVGENSSNGDSHSPSISADGQAIAFISLASNLVNGDDNSYADVFVRNIPLDDTELVSRSSEGGSANAISEWPSLSANGRYVAFHSRATTLVAGDIGDWRDIFVYDRQTNNITRASVNSAGEIALGSSWEASLSADGRFVTFRSKAANLVPDDYNEVDDIFIHDLIPPPTPTPIPSPTPTPTPLPPPRFTGNFQGGASESVFLFTGQHFYAGSTAILQINDTLVGSVNVTNGMFEVQINTTTNNADGVYVVVASVNGEKSATTLLLDSTLPTRQPTSTAVTFTIPDTVAPYTDGSWLPFVTQLQ